MKKKSLLINKHIYLCNMKQVIYLLGFIPLLIASVNAQNLVNVSEFLYLESGAKMTVKGSIQGLSDTVDNNGIIQLTGDWTNNASANFLNSTANNGEVIFYSGTSNQNIGGTYSTEYYDLSINNSFGDVILNQNIIVNNALTMMDGDFDILNSNVDLKTTGSINGENESRRIKVGDPTVDTGTVTITGNINNTTINPGNIGMEFSTTSNLGSTTIIRGHKEQEGIGYFSGNYSICRFYDIIPSNTHDAGLKFSYFDQELTEGSISHTEDSLQMFYKQAPAWISLSTTRDTLNDYAEAGASVYSRFTLASGSLFPDVHITGTADTICFGDSLNIELNALVTSGIAPFSYQWNNGLDTIAGPHIVNPLSTTNYCVTITDVNMKQDSACYQVFVADLPDVSLDVPGSLCLDEAPIQLTQGTPSGGVYAGTGVTGTAFSPGDTGIYIITYTYSNTFGCTDTALDYITVKPVPGIYAGPDVEIEQGSSTHLNAINYEAGVTTWSWNNGSSLNNALISNPVANPYSTTEYIVTGTMDGCSDADTVVVTVKGVDLIIFNTFTPNGDDVNDTWEIGNIEKMQKREVEIYSRLGTLVFVTDDYVENEWDGKYNDTMKQCPAGTYYYIINTDNNIQYYGTVSILY